MFSCKFFEISKSTFFTEHLRTTASTDASVFTPLDWAKIMMLCRIFHSKNSIHLGYLEQVLIFFQQFTVYNWHVDTWETRIETLLNQTLTYHTIEVKELVNLLKISRQPPMYFKTDLVIFVVPFIKLSF